MRDYVIAKYIRLSLDDSYTDSMSIENQRLILDKHISGMDTQCSDIIEFVDNGYSGTNFERPGFQELLDLIHEGKINCVCVKDFSRFGRNSIEAGYFIERVFPQFHVRFISVTDGYDSNDYPGATGGLEVAFKLLLHEYYSVDLSRKIKSAKVEKMKRGEAVSTNGVFGYMLDKNRNMIIDEPAAETVRRIFNLAAAGHGNAEIRGVLQSEKRMTPGEYKKHVDSGSAQCIWKNEAIRKILTDERYIGTYVAGKTRKNSALSKQVTCVPESEWIRLPDHHPAIVDEAIFRDVNDKARTER